MPTHVISANGLEADPTTGDVQIPVFVKIVTLTDAQIKALPSSFFEIVPSPGADKMICFLNVNLLSSFTAQYDNVHDDCRLSVVYGDNTGDGSQLLRFWGSSSGQFFQNAGIAGNTDSSAYWTPYNTATSSGVVVNIENKPLKLMADNSSNGDFLGGNIANSIKIKVVYSILDM